LALPVKALATTLGGLSGAGSRLAFKAVTVVEHPEWGSLTGMAPADHEMEFVSDHLSNGPPSFLVLSGPCTTAFVDGNFCVGRWPGGYGPNEDCAIAVATSGGAAGDVLGACPVFDTQPSGGQRDYLILPDGSRHDGGDCPVGAMLAAGQSLAWQSDGDTQGNNRKRLSFNRDDDPGGGWQLCFEPPPPPPPPPSTFTVISGPCTLSDGVRCVGRWPGGYGPNEYCHIMAGSGVLGGCLVFHISTDTTYGGDYLILSDGSRHDGGDCPAGAALAAGPEPGVAFGRQLPRQQREMAATQHRQWPRRRMADLLRMNELLLSILQH
jgi:hypothetical protein